MYVHLDKLTPLPLDEGLAKRSDSPLVLFEPNQHFGLDENALAQPLGADPLLALNYR